MSSAIRWVAAAAIAPLALAVAGCGKTVSPADIESKIEANVLAQSKTKVTVHCPAGDVDAKKDTTLACTIVLPDGHPTPVVVVLTDASGHVAYTVPADGQLPPGLTAPTPPPATTTAPAPATVPTPTTP